MKIILLLTALVGCFPPAHSLPGYRECSMDSACPEDYHCGFAKLDTFAVCMYDGPERAPGATYGYDMAGHPITH